MAGGAWVNGVYSKVERTATWDYLQAFIDEGHKLNLKVHAGFNTMAGGHSSGVRQPGGAPLQRFVKERLGNLRKSLHRHHKYYGCRRRNKILQSGK